VLVSQVLWGPARGRILLCCPKTFEKAHRSNGKAEP
jgi:hypothetical protein